MGGKPSPCYIVDKITGEIVSEHVSISDAARKLGYHASVSREARNKRMHDKCSYVIRLVDDYNPREDFSGKTRAVPVMCIYQTHVDIYDDLPLVCEALHYSYSGATAAIREHRLVNGECRIEYMPHMGACNELIARGVARIVRR